MPLAHVVLQIDSATTAQFDARSFDLGVTHTTTPAAPVVHGGPTREQDAAPPPPAFAELRLVKQAGPYTGMLIQLSASGTPLPSATIQVLDSAGTSSVTLRLTDVLVVSDHVTLSTARAALEEQRISQQETLTQISIDYGEAQRDLATAEDLAKNRVTTRQELARAREHALELQQRLEFAKQRQQLLDRQLAAESPVEESLVLHVGQVEVDAPAAGGHGAWDFGAASPPPSRVPVSHPAKRARDLRP